MKDIRFAKFVIIINALVPGTLLLWDAAHGRLGANPVNFAILTTGLLALIFLTLTLLVTPLRKITGFSWLFHFRKNLGLYAFIYALTHFLIFFIYDRDLSISSTLTEMVKRKYLIVGSIGLLAMVPLAATSFNTAIKKLGAKRWKALHRLTYVAAGAGALHYYMQVKSDTRQPLVFAAIIGVLLGYRLVAWLAGKRSPHAVPRAAGATPWSGNLRVERITRETPDVRTFRLIPAEGGALPFHYEPGQYLTLSLLIDGKMVRRSYTIASTPSRPGACEVTIKRNPGGVSSVHMHDRVREGDTLAVIAPTGRFVFTGEHAPAVVLLAAGVGITPLMSIVRFLTDHAWPGDIYLIYSNKTELDVIFRREIEDLAARFPNLHVTMTLTRNDSPSWTAHTGRIDAALLTRAVPGLVKLPIYICGPSDMLRATRELLHGLGVPDDNIHIESFGTKPAGAAASPGGAPVFQVTFARSHKTASIPADRSILEAAEEHNIPAEFECRSGICGTCKCRLVAGTVAMAAEDALTPADKAGNIILLCQSRALEDVTVNL